MIMALLPVLTSCGDFFVFESQPEEWEGVTMKIDFQDAYLMVGDSLPLTATFTPYNPNESPIYWSKSDTVCTKMQNDTLVALYPGTFTVMAQAGNGAVTDVAEVNVIDYWDVSELETRYPYDMLFYAKIDVDGEEFNDSTMIVSATVLGNVAGVAAKRNAFGIDYAEIRVWADAETKQGKVTFQCYDRKRHKLYRCNERPGYDAFATYGTLSELYPITFNTSE